MEVMKIKDLKKLRINVIEDDIILNESILKNIEILCLGVDGELERFRGYDNKTTLFIVSESRTMLNLKREEVINYMKLNQLSFKVFKTQDRIDILG